MGLNVLVWGLRALLGYVFVRGLDGSVVKNVPPTQETQECEFNPWVGHQLWGEGNVNH